MVLFRPTCVMNLVGYLHANCLSLVEPRLNPSLFTLKMAPKVAIYGTILMQNIVFSKSRAGANQSQPEPTRADRSRPEPTGANQSQLEPTQPCNGFHMSLQMIDEKFKLNQEKMKEIYGTRLVLVSG